MTFKIDHANLNVFDLQRSIDFYEKALGLHVVSKNQPEHGEFVLAFLSDSASSFRLELTWLKGHQPYELGDNESHICFRTDDYESAHRLHADMGCICYENPGMGLYFIEDPDGYWLEIVPRR
ncbi:MAG TPA: lactoylglutathione lyase [Clostridiales bacterium]|nr:lactoylglutathione lyase [Clostridiales bacterium]